jgi:hypothetical protein
MVQNADPWMATRTGFAVSWAGGNPPNMNRNVPMMTPEPRSDVATMTAHFWMFNTSTAEATMTAAMTPTIHTMKPKLRPMRQRSAFHSPRRRPSPEKPVKCFSPPKLS